MTIAAVTTVAALAVDRYVILALLLAVAVVPGALLARQASQVARAAIAASLPVLVAVALVSALTRAGETMLFVVGPFDVTLEGVDFAMRISLRLVVMAAALVLFGLTTDVHAVVADLERRGLSPRLTFVVASILEAAPALIERGRVIRDAQRARGLDTEGSVRARLRGVLPLAGPAVLGTLHDVEGRSLALEARGFGRPGPRHVLWSPADRGAERAVRWALVAALVVLLASSLSGALSGLP